MDRGVSRQQNLSMPKAVIFDLDDTLVNTSESRNQAWNSVLSSFSARLHKFDRKELAQVLVDTATTFWNETEHTTQRAARTEIAHRSFTKLGVHDPSLIEELVDVFIEHRDQKMKLFPGAESTLEALRIDDVCLALLTNSTAGIEAQKQKIKRFQLKKFFSYIQIEGEFCVGKPDPVAYHNVLDALDVQAEDVWMVGDHLEFDIEAAQCVGILGVWHDHKGMGLPVGHSIRPDHTIASIPGVLDLIQRVKVLANDRY